MKVTVDQLQATKQSPATQGALISVFPESRDAVVKALEAMYDGKNSKEALDEAPKQQIEQLAFQLVRVKIRESRILKRDTAFFRR